MISAAPAATSGLDGLLFLAVGIAGGLLLGAVIASLTRRRPAAAEERARRAPSPASLGLDEDPIVAALVSRSGDPRTARRRFRPDDDAPLT
jgi:hypothetical protein